MKRPRSSSSLPLAIPVHAPHPTRRLPRHWWTGYLFVAPAVILFLLVGVYTIYQSLRLAFSSWDGFSPTMTWVGLDNFRQFLGGNPVTTDEFRQALLHNVALCLVVPACSCLIGLGLALLLNREPDYSSTFFVLPIFCPWCVEAWPRSIPGSCCISLEG